MTKQQVQNLINTYAAYNNITWAKRQSTEVFSRYREQINLLNECMYMEQRYLKEFIKEQEDALYAESILNHCWTGK